MSSMQKALLSSKFPPRSLSQRGRRSSLGRHKSRDNEDYSPVEWNKYFKDRQDVKIGSDSFRVYSIGEEGPLLVLLHGGGFSALTWCALSKVLVDMVELRIIALDLRGHGDTKTSDDTDLSIETMTGLCLRSLPIMVIQNLFTYGRANGTRWEWRPFLQSCEDVINVLSAMHGDNVPPMIVMGHSMGGAVAVHVASSERCPPTLVGVCVIDVVEGTALGALATMQSFLRSRPQSFNSIEDAIKWSLQNGQLRNEESARVSMVGHLKNVQTGATATAELEHHTNTAAAAACSEQQTTDDNAIREDEEASFKVPDSDCGQYTWRINLRATEPHWPGWFQGLSQKFLSARAARLLLLASLDRLDTDLTIGQMQGKFEMHTFDSSKSRCGHAVHEDLPVDVANVVAAFLTRNQFALAKESDYRHSYTMPSC